MKSSPTWKRYIYFQWARSPGSRWSGHVLMWCSPGKPDSQLRERNTFSSHSVIYYNRTSYRNVSNSFAIWLKCAEQLLKQPFWGKWCATDSDTIHTFQGRLKTISYYKSIITRSWPIGYLFPPKAIISSNSICQSLVSVTLCNWTDHYRDPVTDACCKRPVFYDILKPR